MVLARDATINAFAAGWDGSDAALVVTQGALDNLTRDELQGLVAHELSHLRVMDHSPAFWATVATVAPDYAALRRELKQERLPAW